MIGQTKWEVSLGVTHLIPTGYMCSSIQDRLLKLLRIISPGLHSLKKTPSTHIHTAINTPHPSRHFHHTFTQLRRRSDLIASSQITRESTSLQMLGAHCTAHAPTPDPTSGAGAVEEFAGLSTYITGPRDSHRAILLCHDAFGYEVPNLRKLADKIAAKDYLVVVPDFFRGEPCDLSKPGFDVEVWFNTHHPRAGAEDAIKVVIAMKEELKVKTIGAAGFCWGGLPVVRLCSNPEWIQAGVVFHPVALTEDDMKAVKVPLGVFGPEEDEFFPVEELLRLVKVLKEESQLEADQCCHKIYPGTVHGWTTRYNEEDEHACKMAEEAHTDLLDWVTAYVK